MSDKPKHIREIAIPLLAPPESKGLPLLRVRGDDEGPKEMALGVVYPVQDGVPLPPGANLIEMTVEGNHLAVNTIYESPYKPQGGGHGWKPLAVSREKFEGNWDRIFGKKMDRRDLN
jgi:hypothetical protein